MDKVRFGLSNTHIALFDKSNYGNFLTPVKINGAVSLTLQPVYSNFKVGLLSGINKTISTNLTGYTGSVEFATLPYYIAQNVLNYSIDSNGVYTEKSNISYNSFAILFQVLGDKTNRRYILFDTMITSSGKMEYETIGEKVSIKSHGFDIEVRPFNDGINSQWSYKIKSFVDSDNAVIYNNWFNQVYVG